MRQIILDTETTGLKVEEGHRLIEIGCLEMVNRRLTDNRFHCYINPGREVEEGAMAVHGITNHFLRDKPRFAEVAKDFMTFIGNDELIIHNAPFDLSFLNHELMLLGQGWKKITDYCNVIDTLQLARKMHVGQRNSLDALCKRYGVDNSKRDLHGALIDCHLLAQVYLHMTGGQGNFFDAADESAQAVKQVTEDSASLLTEKFNLIVQHATADEVVEHEKYLEMIAKKAKCLWTLN